MGRGYVGPILEVFDKSEHETDIVYIVTEGETTIRSVVTGVSDVNVSLEQGHVCVHGEALSSEALISAVREAGFAAAVTTH